MDNNVLEVALAHSAGAMAVTVRGEIDTLSVPTLKAALDGIDPTSTVSVHMAGVTFMDSSGLSALAVQTMRVGAEGGSLTISHPSSAVRRVVELAGMGELIEEQISR